MKTSTALKLAKKIEKDCRKAQAYCQLSESTIRDFKQVVDHCVASRKLYNMFQRCEPQKLAPSDKKVIDCLRILNQVHKDCTKAMEQCEKATRTIERMKTTVNIMASAETIYSQGLHPNWTPAIDLEGAPAGWYCISFGGRRAGRTYSAVREALANPIAATTPSGYRRAPIKKLPRAIHLPSVAVEIDEDLAMMPPEAIGKIIDRTGG